MRILRGRNARENAFGVVLLALLLLLPAWDSDVFRLQQYEYIIALTLVAVGLNVAAGFAGQLALGPSGIFGLAGYTAAVFANDHPKIAGLALLTVLGIVAASVAGVCSAAKACDATPCSANSAQDSGRTGDSNIRIVSPRRAGRVGVPRGSSRMVGAAL